MVKRIRVRLLSYNPSGTRLVSSAAKTTLSRKPADPTSMSDEDVSGWIRELIRRGHGSPLEHSSYTFSVEGCSRVFTHQLVRHRIASYTQQSMRYSEGYLRNQALEAAAIVGIECPRSPREGAKEAYDCYSRSLEAVLESSDDDVLRVASIAYVIPLGMRGREASAYARALLMATSIYYKLLASGVKRERARYAIPQAVRTNIVFTMNARTFLESFLPLRLCTRAQSETRAIAWRIRDILLDVHPVIFRYAGPRCVLYENMTRGDPCTLDEFLGGVCKFGLERCPELVPNEGIPSCLASARPKQGLS